MSQSAPGASRAKERWVKESPEERLLMQCETNCGKDAEPPSALADEERLVQEGGHVEEDCRERDCEHKMTVVGAFRNVEGSFGERPTAKQPSSGESILPRRTSDQATFSDANETSTINSTFKQYESVNCYDSNNVYCLKFRRNFTPDQTRITEIAYAIEEQFGTTRGIMDIEKRTKVWQIWVKGEWMKNQLIQKGLFIKNRLYRITEKG